LYDFLAGSGNIGKHKSYSKMEMIRHYPNLKINNLLSSFSYYYGQMDDYQLGLWAASQVKKYNNLIILENMMVDKLDVNGEVYYDNKKELFDRVVNVAGPWSEKLLKDNNIYSDYELDIVRGSHIIVDKELDLGYFLEVPNERRIFFVLPYQNQTLIGVTEVRQSITDDINPTQLEINYLINAYNYYSKDQITEQNVVKSFAGLRPLVKSAQDVNKATRGIRYPS
jgi:glycerol-3-phosphate dehydrogenase